MRTRPGREGGTGGDERLADILGERGRITRRDQPSNFAMKDNFARGAKIAGDDRQSHRARLRRHPSERLRTD